MNDKVKSFVKFIVSALIGAVCTYFGIGCTTVRHIDSVYTPSLFNMSK